MSKLFDNFDKFRDKFGVPIIKVSEETGIRRDRLYRFSAGNGDLRNDDAIKLNNYLKQFETEEIS